MDEDKKYIPDTEEVKHYTLAEAYELLKQEQDDERIANAE